MRSRRILLLVLTLTGAAAAPQSPAGAAWHVDHVNWTYANTPNLNQDIVDPATLIVVGRRQVTVSNGDAWVTLTAYAKQDGGGSPIRVQQSLNARSQLRATLILAGSPPPPKPTTWYQRSYVSGQCSLDINETVGFGGGYEASAGAKWGAPAPPPGANVCVSRVLTSDGSDSHVHTGWSQLAEELNWFARAAGSAYHAAFVRAEGQIDLQGYPPGTVVINSRTWANQWGIYWQ